MDLTQFKALDTSFKLVSGDEKNIKAKSISHITEPVDGSFVFCKNTKYLSRLGQKNSKANFDAIGIIFEAKFFESLSLDKVDELKKSFLWIGTVANISLAMTYYSKPFYEKKFKDINYLVDGRQLGTCDIHASAQIAQHVFIGEHVKIASNVVIMPGARILSHVEIAEGSIIFPNVVIYPYVKIGKHTRVHGNVTIGADGFGYSYHQGIHLKIWHFSGVEIGDHVEIGANATVDAGAFYPTRIGSGTKIDNHSTIGHNAQLGVGVVVCGQGAIAGSAELGDFSMMGGKAGLGPDVRLGKGVQIAASAIVSEGAVVEDGEVLAGHPARPVKEWLKVQAHMRKIALGN